MRIYRRDWLNKKEGTAFIESKITSGKYGNFKVGYVHGDICIADCSRQISLDFGVDTKEDVDVRLAKLDVMQAHIDLMRTALVDARRELPSVKELKAEEKRMKEIRNVSAPITIDNL